MSRLTLEELRSSYERELMTISKNIDTLKVETKESLTELKTDIKEMVAEMRKTHDIVITHDNKINNHENELRNHRKAIEDIQQFRNSWVVSLTRGDSWLGKIFLAIIGVALIIFLVKSGVNVIDFLKVLI